MLKRRKKSIARMNGSIVVMNSSDVVRLLSLIISENIMDIPIRYKMVKAPAIHIITLAIAF